MTATRPQPPGLAERIRPSRRSSAHPPGQPPLVVGLVGGVGCGKSTVADAIFERRYERNRETLLIDGDSVGHETRDRPEVQERIVEVFGRDVLGDDGLIDRQLLAIKVFQSGPGTETHLATLNGIMHPAMRAEFENRIETTAAPLVLFDAAILLEAGWDDLCDEVILLDVSESDRLARVTERGWTEEQWRAREASQFSLDRKRSESTIIAANDGDPEATADAILELLELSR